MYKKYFAIEELPFSNTADPAFLYMSEQHREAFAHMLYGVNNGAGIIVLTGEVGSGKTLLCKCLSQRLPTEADIALVHNTKISTCELFVSICEKLKISYPIESVSIKVLLDAIQRHLNEQISTGRKTIVIIDEAQNLSIDTLEHIRLLSNLETDKSKLLQFILVGQPALNQTLTHSDIGGFAQRIGAHYHLNALSRDDVSAYVKHRLAVAGTTKLLFPEGAVRTLVRLSRGIPRLINAICDRTLLATYAQNKPIVTQSVMKSAAQEVFGVTTVVKNNSHFAYAAAFIVAIALSALFISWHPDNTDAAVTLQAPTQNSPEIIKNHSAQEEQLAGLDELM